MERSEVLDALETTPPRWAGAAVVVLVAVLSVRGARGGEALVVCAWAVGMATYASAVALGAGVRVADLALALAPAIAAAVGGVTAFGLALPMAPFQAQEPGGRVMLALRVLVFALVCLRPLARDEREKRTRVTVALFALLVLFVLSLVAQGLVLVLVVASSGAMRATRALAADESGARSPRATGSTPAAFATLAALALVSGLAFAASFAHEATPPTRSPREQVEDWRARGNPFRARATALEWAKREEPPGEAYLALASIDWDLGHVEQARRVLAKVLSPAASEEARRRADELSRSWGEGPR